jgi:DHA2 family multidrug resistance protein
VLFGTTVLIPQFLQNLLGYTAERAGMVLSPAGFMLMGTMLIAGKLVSKFDPRLLVSLGFLATAVGLYNLTRLDLNASFAEVTLWRMYQMLGLAFIFIPISTLNYIGVPREKNNQISSFSNFARNLGGSVGTAMLTTFLARTEQVHQSQLAAHVLPDGRLYRAYVEQTRQALMAHGQDAATASRLAMGHAYSQMVQQATMLSYVNAFWVLSVMIACLVPLPFIMRRPPRQARVPAEAAGH